MIKPTVPLITVVVPCFNDGIYLDDAIRSVTQLERKDIEIIVVDDGSSDPATITVLDALRSSGVMVIRQNNAGLAKARNTGIQAARSEFIIPLDADNRLRGPYVHEGLSILRGSSKVGVVYGDAQYFGLKQGRWQVGSFALNRLMAWNYIDACALFRKSVWEDICGYDSKMPVQGFEDWDFWMSAAKRGWEFHYLKSECFDYRVRQGSMITNANKHLEATEAYIATKHALLYRNAFLELNKGHGSFRFLTKRLIQNCIGRVTPD